MSILKVPKSIILLVNLKGKILRFEDLAVAMTSLIRSNFQLLKLGKELIGPAVYVSIQVRIITCKVTSIC
jgi:hypothetical protein